MEQGIILNMKAFRIYQTGGPEVMRWEDVEVGDPGPGQVRLRHTAVGLNFRDILVRRGAHPVQSFPSGIGIESAGVIDALGPGVSGLSVGQRVVCVAGPDGAYAEARLVPAARVVPLPEAIDERTAASMMIRGMTARYLLRETYAVKRGDTVLVHAAAGGVGLILCQWAKHLGATVIGTVGNQAKAEIACAHGCDHTIVYTAEDFAERVRALTVGAGVPVVYDSIGKATFEKSLACLRPRGLLVSFGEASGDPEPIAPRRLGQLGSIYLTHPSLPDYTATRSALLACAGELFDMVGSGKIKIEINQSYALADAPRAHREVESRQTTGCTVLIP
jgi:NADPH2:quinone reductase